MAYDFEKALKSGTNPEAIKSYLASQGRQSEYDSYFNKGTSTKTVSPNNAIPVVKASPVTETNQPNFAQNYLTRLMDGYGQDVNKFKEGAQRSADKYSAGVVESKNAPTLGKAFGGQLNASVGLIEGGLNAASAGASAVFRPITTGIGQAIDASANLFSDNKSLQKFANTPAVAHFLDSISGISGSYDKLKQSHPDIVRNLEDIVNITLSVAGEKIGPGKLPTTQEIKTGLTETAGKVKDITGKVVDTLTPSPKDYATEILPKVDAKIEQGFAKGVKPGVKQNLSEKANYDQKVNTAVKNIVRDKNQFSYMDEVGNIKENKVPQSVSDLEQAVSMGKKKSFEEYNKLKDYAGEGEVKVKLQPVINELETIANNKVINTQHPNVAEYARNLADRYKKASDYSLNESQDAIASLNAQMKGPADYNSMNIRRIDELVNSKLRKETDNTISSLSGEGYQKFKNDYGAYRAIEDDIVKRNAVEARKNGIGLLEGTADILSGGQIVSAILNANPTSLASGLTQKGISNFIKWKNAPDTNVRKMFDYVDKHYIPEATKSADEIILESQAQRASSVKLPGTYTDAKGTVRNTDGSIPMQSSSIAPNNTEIPSGMDIARMSQAQAQQGQMRMSQSTTPSLPSGNVGTPNAPIPVPEGGFSKVPNLVETSGSKGRIAPRDTQEAIKINQINQYGPDISPKSVKQVPHELRSSVLEALPNKSYSADPNMLLKRLTDDISRATGKDPVEVNRTLSIIIDPLQKIASQRKDDFIMIRGIINAVLDMQ